MSDRLVIRGGEWCCAEHRRYQAKRAPRVACESCWGLWFKIVLKKPTEGDSARGISWPFFRIVKRVPVT